MTDEPSRRLIGTPADQADEPAARRRGAPIHAMLHSHPSMGPLVVLVAAAIVFNLLNGRFLSATNLSIMLEQVAVIGFLASRRLVLILHAGTGLPARAAT